MSIDYCFESSSNTGPPQFRGPYLQEKFLRLVELEEEKKEQIKLKCWAGFATEEKMRDELKFSASIPQKQISMSLFFIISKQVKIVCFHHVVARL